MIGGGRPLHPIYKKIWPKLIDPFQNANFQSIFAHSASTVTLSEKVQLENVSIAIALQLKAPRRHASPFPLYLQCHAKFEVAEPLHCCIIAFLLLIHYLNMC